MEDDQIFRLILILGFVVVFPVGLYHRLKAHASKDKLDRRQEGIFILLTLRPIALLKMLGMLAYVIHPAWMAWSSVGLPSWLRWIGVPLGVMAATLLIVTFRFLGTNITDTVYSTARQASCTTDASISPCETPSGRIHLLSLRPCHATLPIEDLLSQRVFVHYHHCNRRSLFAQGR